MSKYLHLAPIVTTTAGVAALISFRLEDTRLKKILRMIAAILLLGSVATVAGEAIRLIEQGAQAQRVIAEQQRLSQEELAKAAEASARAKNAEEIAKQAALRAEELERTARLRMEEAERAARLRIQEIEQDAKRKADESERQARIQADRDEQIRREQADRWKREQINRDNQERQRQRQVREAEIASKRLWCETCCTKAFEPLLHPNSLPGYVGPCVSRCLRPGAERLGAAAHCHTQ